MAPSTSKTFSVLTNIRDNFKERERRNVDTMDTPFRLSGKYSPIFVIILMCLSFGNQFFRNLEIDCTSPQLDRNRGASELNEFCWKTGTFLVEKALEPNLRRNVTHPGISSYTKGKDELLSQSYYKSILLGLGITEIVTLLPLLLWKLKRSVPKLIRSVTQIDLKTKGEGGDKDTRRVEAFIKNIGVNNGAALWYFICKSLAFASTMFPWFYFSGLIGKHFKWYGVDVLTYLVSRDNWPNPMDVVFPKIAKCQWTLQEGSSEELYGLCQLPMNEITQWSFFFFWWWIVLVFSVNVTHFLYFVPFVFPAWRNHSFRGFVAKICHGDTNLAEHFPEIPASKNKQDSKAKISDEALFVSISDESWFLLNFMEQNLPAKEFRSFIRKLVVTPNSEVQLKNAEEYFNGMNNGSHRGDSSEEETTESDVQIAMA